jgi:hypothetical protein
LDGTFLEGYRFRTRGGEEEKKLEFSVPGLVLGKTVRTFLYFATDSVADVGSREISLQGTPGVESETST